MTDGPGRHWDFRANPLGGGGEESKRVVWMDGGTYVCMYVGGRSSAVDCKGM